MPVRRFGVRRKERSGFKGSNFEVDEVVKSRHTGEDRCPVSLYVLVIFGFRPEFIPLQRDRNDANEVPRQDIVDLSGRLSGF